MNEVVRDSASEYHSKKEFISSTALRQMALSAKHFFDAWTKPGIDSTSAMDNGEFLHSLVLEQDVNKFVPRPLKDGRLVATNTKDYAAFLDANPGKTPIHPDLFNMATECLTAFCDSKAAMNLLKDARVENSIYTTDPDTNLSIRARPDIWGSGILVDLKTTGKRLDWSFEKTIFSSGYDVQLAHYAETILAATGEEIKEFRIIAMEQNSPFGVKVYKVPTKYILEAKMIRRTYLNRIAVCLEDSMFPGYDDQIIEVERPKYLETYSLEGSF